jgi:hypothetical protein
MMQLGSLSIEVVTEALVRSVFITIHQTAASRRVLLDCAYDQSLHGVHAPQRIDFEVICIRLSVDTQASCVGNVQFASVPCLHPHRFEPHL